MTKLNRLGTIGAACAALLLLSTGIEQCPEPEGAFSFAIIADPHLSSGEPEHEQRLRDCVDWINANQEGEGIDLVFIAGDIGSQMELAREILDGLKMPYLPVLGDNAVQGGYESLFQSAFDAHFDEVAAVLEGWKRAPTPVYNPEIDAESYFQNFSFYHKGVHFVGLDWATRIVDPILGELADLHNFPGGTYPWFQQDIEESIKDVGENIVLISHHPMSAQMFDPEENQAIDDVTAPVGSFVYGNFYGHLHYRDLIPDHYKDTGGYWLYLTEASHVADNNIGLVHVSEGDSRFTYQYEDLDIP